MNKHEMALAFNQALAATPQNQADFDDAPPAPRARIVLRKSQLGLFGRAPANPPEPAHAAPPPVASTTAAPATVTTTPVRYVVPGIGTVETLKRRWPNGSVKILNGDGRWLPAGHPNLFSMRDKHGNIRGGKRVKGTYSADVPCDARCTNAKGHLCTCSCGGANHGAGVSVPLTKLLGIP